MAQLILHGVPTSSSTGRVLTTLHEKQVSDFTLQLVDLPNNAHKRPPHLFLQPFGLIPVLQDGDITIFESRAIARYIALKYENQGTPLYGRTKKERASVEQWLEVESQNFHPLASALVYQLSSRPKKGEAPQEEVVRPSMEKLEKVLDVYDTQLAYSPYLAGDFFSLADLSHLPRTKSLIGSAKQSHLFMSRPHVYKWWQRISSRPSWVKVTQMAEELVTV